MVYLTLTCQQRDSIDVHLLYTRQLTEQYVNQILLNGGLLHALALSTQEILIPPTTRLYIQNHVSPILPYSLKESFMYMRNSLIPIIYLML